MYRITKEFSFSASHQLRSVPAGHPCSRLHGHNYRVEIELAAQTLTPAGFVRDYLELSALRDYIDETLDHRHLNEVLGDDKVTAEQLARHLYDWAAARWPETCALRVSETPKTWAEYRPKSPPESPSV